VNTLSNSLFKTYLLWPDPHNIEFDMEKIVERALQLKNDNDIKAYLGVTDK